MMLSSTWQAQRGAKSVHRKALTYIQELQIDPNVLLESMKQQLKTTIKTKHSKQKINTIKEKKVQGQYFTTIDEP